MRAARAALRVVLDQQQQSWLALPDPFPLWAAGVVGMARGRLQEERKAWRKDHPTGFVAKPLMLPDGTQDILNWAVVLPGKEGTIWEGARIPMKMQFSEDYPNQPPVCTFKPIASTGEPLFHPNVGPSGKIGLSLLDATKGGQPHTTHAHRHHGDSWMLSSTHLYACARPAPRSVETVADHQAGAPWHPGAPC